VKETDKEMAAANEDWSEWDGTLADGLESELLTAKDAKGREGDRPRRLKKFDRLA